MSHEVIVNPIALTPIRKGLTLQLELDSNSHLKGVKVADEAFAAIRLDRATFMAKWNYTIRPSSASNSI